MRRPFAVLLALLALLVLPGQTLAPPYGTPNYQMVYVNGVPVVTGVADTLTLRLTLTSAAWPAWKVTSSGTPTPTVYGRFVRYFAAAAPTNTTDPCVAGDQVLAITPAAGVPNGWFCSAANTWTAF